MTSPVLTEGFYSGAFLIREANGYLSRDQGVMVNAGGVDLLVPGGLVVSLSETSTAAAAPLGSNTGNGTVGLVILGPAATPGGYVANFESATAYTVMSPAGQEIGHGTVGSGFSAGGLSFTISAGGTAFIPGDAIGITVVNTTPNTYVPYTPTSGPAAAILYNRTVVPANGTKKVTLITRLAEVNVGEIQWDPTVLAASNVATIEATALGTLSAAGIVFRAIATSAG